MCDGRYFLAAAECEKLPYSGKCNYCKAASFQ